MLSCFKSTHLQLQLGFFLQLMGWGFMTEEMQTISRQS